MTRIGWFLVVGALALASVVSPAAANGRAAETSYVLDHDGPDTVNGGSEVTFFLTATDPGGEPVSGLSVRFVRTGPGPETWESCSVQRLAECSVTAGGQVYADFGVGSRTGVVEVRAQVYSPEGVLLAEVGPDPIEVYVSSCSSVRARCSPLSARLHGASKPGRDVLKVRGPHAFRNARVVLMRRAGGPWVATGRLAKLGETGDCTFSVPDRNGPGVTKYRAAVLPSAAARGDVTPVVRLR